MKPALLKRLKRLEEIVASRGRAYFGLSAEDEELHQREIEWYRFTAFNVGGLSRSSWWCEKYPGEPFPESWRAMAAADDADRRFRLSAEDLVNRCIRRRELQRAREEEEWRRRWRHP